MRIAKRKAYASYSDHNDDRLPETSSNHIPKNTIPAREGDVSEKNKPVTCHGDELPDTYTIIDIETTGLSPKICEIIELSALRIEKNVITDNFSTMICPIRQINSKIENLTGITNTMLKQQGRDIRSCLEAFLAFIGSNTLVGHNLKFDLGFINHYCEKISLALPENQKLDTLVLSKRLLPNLAKYTLKSLAESLELEHMPSHRGLIDCHTTQELFDKLKKLQVETRN
jgi:DNA polymerase-3 subunit alpha (Gram-positive type)